MADNTDVEAVKETIIDAAVNGKFIAKLIAWFTGVIAAAATGILVFIVQLHTAVPLMQKDQQGLRDAVSTMQSSLNRIQVDNQDLKTNQSVMNEQIKNINQKLNYQ